MAIETESMTGSAAEGAFDPGEVLDITCDGCKTKMRRTAGSARAAGWRVWDGITVSGGTASVRICPLCLRDKDAPRDPAEPLPPDHRWDAECETCYLTASSDWAEDFDGTKEDAEYWMQEHRCEPETRIIKPKVLT